MLCYAICVHLSDEDSVKGEGVVCMITGSACLGLALTPGKRKIVVCTMYSVQCVCVARNLVYSS